MKKKTIRILFSFIIFISSLFVFNNVVSASPSSDSLGKIYRTFENTDSFNQYHYVSGNNNSYPIQCLDAQLAGADFSNGQSVASVTNFNIGSATSNVKKYIYYVVKNNYYTKNPQGTTVISNYNYQGNIVNITDRNFANALHIAICTATGTYGISGSTPLSSWSASTQAAYYLITSSTGDPDDDPNYDYDYYFVETTNPGTNQSYVTWDRTPREKSGALKIHKILNTRGATLTENYAGFKFDIYDSTGTTKITTITTNSNGYACYGFSDNANCTGTYTLQAGTSYVIKEVMDNSALNYSWSDDVQSISAAIVSDQVKEVNYTNSLEKYCIKVKKVDSSNRSLTVDGITFNLYNSNSSDASAIRTGTTSNGIVTFNELSKPNGYYIKETGTTSEYFNDNASFSGPYEATKMTYSNDTFSCPGNANTIEKSDLHKKYCFKVKKVDSVTGEVLSGATFKAVNGNTTLTATSDSNGIATFFTGQDKGNYSVTETTAPSGYKIDSTTAKVITPIELTEAKTDSTTPSDCEDTRYNTSNNFVYKDSKNIITWYKVTEDESTKAKGAEFTVATASGTKIYHAQAKQNHTDSAGNVRSCYVYSATSTGTNSDVFISDNNGQVCVIGVDNVKYNITETKPSAYHTFSSSNVITNLQSSTAFTAMNSNNKIINKPTEFEFTKYVTSGDDDSWENITTESLKKIEFNILDSNGNVLSFIKTAEGKYSYAGNDIDRPSGTQVTGLYLDDDRKFYVEHLPVGTYSVKEKTNANGTCDCTIDGSNCIGFYTPKYTNESDYKFTITNCSNASATASVCTTHKASTQSLENIPTEIKFTKSDLYGYEDASDVVDFENDQERNDFDRIVFKLKDENGNYLKLVKVGNNGSCLTDDSYAEYRYVTDDLLPLLTDAQRANLTEELHTCGGHIKITHLCRGKKYYIEEVSVPENSVFVLPENEAARTREYNIPCCGDTTTSAVTTIIEDKPTRVRFEKRDSKYNYLIPDETTTFNVYQCKKGTTCHPSDGISADMKLMKFSARAVINGDQEDPNDVAGLAGVEVYKAMSDSDVQRGQDYVTDLHPYHGILVLRYLPSGYNYVLLETVAPKNYSLPRGRDAETYFTVVNDTVEVEEIDRANTPTSLLIRKYSTDGKLLTGAKFKVYKGTTCDKNLSAMNQPKEELKLKTIRDGLYEARPEEDTSIIQTCSDKNGTCSSIPVNEVTKLTYSNYLGTWADFDNTINDNNEKIELQEGTALIQYLEYGNCYIIEEIQAPEGYSLPKNEEDRFTMVTIEENEKFAKDTYKTLVNAPTPFTFYKYDEYNKLLDGAEFKLQKLDNDKKYQDLTVKQEEKNGELYYKVDKTSDNKTITTKGGKATVYYLSSGQYRIIETKAAPGKELSKNPNIATFFVDDSGNVYGNGIIVNKAKTQKIEVKNSSSAEYILGIQTGQNAMKYGLIISSIAALLVILFILKKKVK